MILLAHLLLGAVVGSKVKNLPAAAVPAPWCHYFVDLIRHTEYSVEHITSRNWKKSLPDFLKVFLDFSAGIMLITLVSNRNPFIYACAMIAVIPDMVTLLSLIFPNKILTIHDRFHTDIHFLANKKISTFWRIFTQVFTVIACIILLR